MSTFGLLLLALLPLTARGADTREPAAQKSRVGFHQGDRVSFRYDSRWQGPLPIDDGVKLVLPGGRAQIAAAFIPITSPRYRTPAEFRKLMRARKSTEDDPELDVVMVAGRFASRTRYTTHSYAGKELLLESTEVTGTELIMIPDPRGLYVIKYEAPKQIFEGLRLSYELVLKTLSLPKIPGYTPDTYYRERDNLVKDLVGKGAVTGWDAPSAAGPGNPGWRSGLEMRAAGTIGFGPTWTRLMTEKTSVSGYLAIYHSALPWGPPSGFPSLAQITIGAAGRLHPKGAARTGPYLLAEFAIIKAFLPGASGASPAGAGTLVGDAASSAKSIALRPAAGLGYQHIFDGWIAEAGLSFGFGGKITQDREALYDSAGTVTKIAYQNSYSTRIGAQLRASF